MTLCECGCGQEVGFRTDKPNQMKRFVLGHNGRKLRTPLEPKLCECGCGQVTPISDRTNNKAGYVLGQHRRYVPGHAHRGRTRTFSEEHRKNLSVALVGNQNCLGKQNTLGLKHSEETRAKITGPNNPRWKEDVGYGGLHTWVKRHKSKTGICSHCERDVGFGTQAGTHWANVDGEYRRALEDYIELCPDCHGEYDRERGLRKLSGPGSRKKPKSTPVDAPNAS
jgi:hypothetical protein